MKAHLLTISLLIGINSVSNAQTKIFTSIDSVKKSSDPVQLDLSHKNLKSIPKEVFEYKNLKVLDLTGNDITSIPSDIKKLSSLEVLKLDSNAITSISKEVLNLKNLKGLSISTDVIGKQSALETVVYLNTIGDHIESKRILEGSKENLLVNLGEMDATNLPIWKGTTHSLGFINSAANATIISDATKIVADQLLKNSGVKITLDLLYVHDYPGNGRHRVLVEFSGKNQISEDTKEQVNYALTRTVQEGEFAGLRSVPMVVGLRVGGQGVEFKCTTINVKNENDENLMAILDNETTNEGLKLLSTVNPVIPIVTNLISGIGTQFLTRNDNKKIQEFNVGLDFGVVSTRAKLAQGSYIVAQTGKDSFNWADWELSANNGTILKKSDQSKLPYNYLVFSVSKVD